MKSLYFCLVSRQTIPNALLYLDPDILGSDVVLFCAPDVESFASVLEAFFKGHGGQVTRVQLASHVKPDKVYSGMKPAFEARQQGQPVIVNLTAGTKVMSIAACQLAREYGLDCIYFDQGRVHVIKPAGLSESCHSFPVRRFLTIEETLRLYGYRILESQKPEQMHEHRGVLHLIAEMLCDRDKKQLRADLIETMKQVRQSQGKAEITRDLFLQLPIKGNAGQRWKTLLRFFRKIGTMPGYVEVSKSRIELLSPVLMTLLGGGFWLEWHACLQARKVAQVDEVLSGVKVAKADQSDRISDYEIDLIVRVGDTLFLAECKARSVALDKRGGESVREAFRIRGLAESLSGSKAVGIFVFLDDLSKKLHNKLASAKVELVGVSKALVFDKTLAAIIDRHQR